MRIQFLSADGCPGTDGAYARLEAVVNDLVPGTPIEKIRVTSAAAAREHKFHGSPSIHIDGRDLEHGTSHPPSLDCRDYGDGEAPPKWLIEVGILRALSPKGILFLCVANSARSQIGEGIARMLAPAGLRVQSAGSHPTGVRPEAVKVLSEWGLDTSLHFSKHVNEINPDTVDTVITLCAEEKCPLFLGKAYRLHWGLPDPAAAGGDRAKRVTAFRRVRDTLRRRLELLLS